MIFWTSTMCVYIYIYTHTHSPTALLISAHSPLTHSPSHCRPKFCYRQPKLSITHSRSTLTVYFVLFLFALCLSLQNHFIIYIYIYIYCIQTEMFVSYESHLPSKGTRNHMTSLPSTQTKSLTPCLFHIIFVPKPSPCIHQGGGFVDSYYLKKEIKYVDSYYFKKD